MAMECSWNDGSKTQYYVVILDRLPGRSGGLERAPEWRVRGPLILTLLTTSFHILLLLQVSVSFYCGCDMTPRQLVSLDLAIISH